MTDAAQLPHLLKLLDDESETVRVAVSAALGAFGPELRALAVPYQAGLSEGARGALATFMQGHDRETLRARWPAWQAITQEKARLEAALSLLSEFQRGFVGPARLGPLLDELAAEFERAHPQGDASSLARFLFEERGLRGARENYDDPRNSDLAYVIEERWGIPISLACVYILVGHRRALPIEGCNFPRHFLAHARVGERSLLVDCFHGGRMLSDKIVVKRRGRGKRTLLDSAMLRADALRIVGRTLNNLARAFERAENPEHGRTLREILEALPDKGFEPEKDKDERAPDAPNHKP